MAIKQNNELNVLMKNGSKANPYKKDTVDVCADRKTVNVKTARDLVVELAFQTGNNKIKSDNLEKDVNYKYIHVEPATRRIARQIATQDENSQSITL